MDNEIRKHNVQALLTEYESCEDYVDSAASRNWQIASIIWAAALLGLFVLGVGDNSLTYAIFTTVLLVLVIAMLWIFWAMIRRMIFFQIAARQRMREIECQLNMRKDIYFYLLDNWKTKENTEYWKYLSEDEAKKLEINYTKKGKGAPSLRTSTASQYINVALIIAWFALTTVKWSAYVLL